MKKNLTLTRVLMEILAILKVLMGTPEIFPKNQQTLNHNSTSLIILHILIIVWYNTNQFYHKKIDFVMDENAPSISLEDQSIHTIIKLEKWKT